MSFAAPWFLAAGAAVALGVVALHFLARRRPPAFLFPTARFIPDTSSRAPAFASRPADLLLLLLRVAAVLLLAAAFARPLGRPERRTVRVVVADVSRSVASLEELRDSLGAILRPDDHLVVFDSVARPARAADGLTLSRARGSLSAALVVARREAENVGRRADSLELVIISPFASEEWDAATGLLRSLWPGRARLIPIAPAPPAARGVIMAGSTDDPLRASLTLGGLLRESGGETSVRLSRSRPTLEDTAWARRGGTLVHWPEDLRQAGWPAGLSDTVGAVAAGEDVVVASFERVAEPPGGIGAAWWVDGRVAATVTGLGAGCVVNVAIPVARVGDLALRAGMRRLVSRITEPCGAPVSGVLDGAQRATLAGGGSLFGPDYRSERDPRRVPATGWLLAVAAVLVLVEPLARGRRRT